MLILVVSCRYKRALLVMPLTYTAIFVILAPPLIAIVLDRY